jgi:hypothetical protein
MNGLRLLKGAAVALATLGLSIPSPKLFAADPPTKGNPAAAQRPQKSQIPDVSLTAGGVFSGRVIDHAMNPLEGAEVVVKQGKNEIARTVTDSKGQFTVQNMKGGVYQVTSGNTDGVFRVWTERTAPPVAKQQQALLVLGENGARGQFGAIDPTIVLLTAGVIAAVVLSAIAVDKINSVQNCCNKQVFSP